VPVPHFSVNVVARGSGRSAVMSAAYRHCARMTFEREGRTVDYSRKQGLIHQEFDIPFDAPVWLKDLIADRPVVSASEVFWNKVEDFEKRQDAQLAKDLTIALPRELDARQNFALVREFVDCHITARGMIADWVCHDNPGNPHVHMMTTLRPLTAAGFGPKKIPVLDAQGNPLRNNAGKIIYELWAGGLTEFNALRDGWFSCQNKHLALAGLDIRIDGRSLKKQGLELAPTIHVGVASKAIERKAGEQGEHVMLERCDLQQERRAENARRIGLNPGIVLDLITRERSVFDERDVTKVLHRYIDDAVLFQNLMVRILQNPQALRLDRERIDFLTGQRIPAKYTTRELIRFEAEMANRSVWLSRHSSHGVRQVALETVLAGHRQLSDEQRTAVEHVAGGERIAAIIGRAGAGKTTMMKAAREAWEACGYRVVGGALAGKAAEGLEKEAGIRSRTLSSWELRWRQDRNKLDTKTVFVLDEAGMVSSRQMAALVETVAKYGAKLVLVGDPEQLQPIEAGAAFRAICDRIGYAELETIYRQREQWMREASLCLARGNVAEALNAYRSQGRLIGASHKTDAISRLIADWDRDHDPDKSSLILAHLRRDVRKLNELARQKLVERGLVDDGSIFKTAEGARMFAAGDRIVFLKNDGKLGVKNGMLGRVVEAGVGRIVVVIGTGSSGGEDQRQITLEERFYNNLDHGYATTIHKSQGATVDQVKVLASLSLDRHLTYVAMTRHRHDLDVYFSEQSFAKAGGLVQLLSRKNAKETTLDYADRGFYRQALQFAEARGLHLVTVARTLVFDRIEWTLRQRQSLIDLGLRLAAVASRLGLVAPPKVNKSANAIRTATPMVSGIKTFAKSIEQSVEDKLAADPVLKKQWEDVSTRFHLVYARPEAAFKAVNVDAMLTDSALAASTLFAVTNEPQGFGALKGQTGMFAGKGERKARETALCNVPALSRNLERFIEMRTAAERKYQAEEQEIRRAMSIDIPALSASASSVFERVRDAVNRNDLATGLSYALADKMVKAELDHFAKAVSDRFGARTFLGIAAKTANGETYRTLTAPMPEKQKTEVLSAWSVIRIVQQLAAHERASEAITQSEAMRQTHAKGLSLK